MKAISLNQQFLTEFLHFVRSDQRMLYALS